MKSTKKEALEAFHILTDWDSAYPDEEIEKALETCKSFIEGVPEGLQRTQKGFTKNLEEKDEEIKELEKLLDDVETFKTSPSFDYSCLKKVDTSKWL